MAKQGTDDHTDSGFSIQTTLISAGISAIAVLIIGLPLALIFGGGDEEPVVTQSVVESDSITEPTLEPPKAPAATEPSPPVAETESVTQSPQTKAEEPAQANEAYVVKPNPFLITAPPSVATAPEKQENKSFASTATDKPGKVDPLLKLYPLERPVASGVYDPHSRRLVVAEEEQNQVSFYELQAEPKLIATEQTVPKPTNLYTKRYKGRTYLMVGGKLDKQIDVFDAATNQRIGTVGVQVENIVQFGSSQNENDPYVYYAISSEQNSRLQHVGRLHLDTMEDEGIVHDGANSFAVSPEGTKLYTRTTNFSPTGIDSFRLVPGAAEPRQKNSFRYSSVRLEPLHDEHDTSPAYIPGPHGAFVAAGPQLYSSTLREKMGRMEFGIDLFLPRTPWVLGIDDNKLSVGSTNDKRTVKTLQLPTNFLAKKEMFDYLTGRDSPERVTQLARRLRRHSPLIFDPTGERVIAVGAKQVALLELQSLELPQEPLLALELGSEPTFDIASPAPIPLRSFDDRIETRLLKGPKGLTFEDQQLKLSANATEVGEVETIIERKLGRLRMEQRISVLLTRPRILLGFRANYAKLSHDGKLAIVYGNEPTRNDQPVQSNLAIVDIQNRKIIGKKKLERRVLAATINDGGAYLLVRPSDNNVREGNYELLQLSMPEFSLSESREVIAAKPTLEIAGDEILSVHTNHFSLPKLKPLTPSLAEVPRGGSRNTYPMRRVQQTPESWYWDDIYWDNQLSKALLVMQCGDFVHSGQSLLDRVVTPWSRTYNAASVSSLGGDSVISGSVSNQRGPLVIISPVMPAALRLSERRNVGTRREKLMQLEVLDLDKGGVVQSISLGLSNRSASGVVSIDAAADVTLACINDRSVATLFVINESEIERTKLTLPFRFQPLQSEIVLSTRGRSNLQYELLNGKPPYNAKLILNGETHAAEPGRTVSFSIDGGTIAKKTLNVVSQLRWPQHETGEPKARVLDYVNAIEPKFRRMVGRKPSGVPVAIQATVEVTDSEARTISLQHQYFVELPAAAVVSKLSERYRPRPTTPSRTQRTTVANTKAETAEQRRARREQEEQLKLEMEVAYSTEFREQYPAKEISPTEFPTQAAKARQAVDNFLAKSIDMIRQRQSKRPRAWHDRKGRKITASLRAVFADEVTLAVPKRGEHKLSIEKLSDEDQAFLEQLDKPVELGGNDHPKLQMELLLTAVLNHVKRTGNYPPAYLVDEQGKPLLSWRVALLPDMGGEQLLSLFNLDEPWDSEHNKRLVEFMPTLLSTAPAATESGQSTILGLTGSKGVLSDGQPLSRGKLVYGGNNALLFAEVRPEKAIAWTRPKDLHVSMFRELPEFLRDRDGQTVVGAAMVYAGTLPIKSDVKDWYGAVDYSKRQQLPINFGL